MKVVHTADWHLGKRLENKSRLVEQRAALDELNELCDREKADIVLVAGDVFDTAVPPAEAEELFFTAVTRLAKRRPVVVIAGNHDDPDRLVAPRVVARSCGIYLVGGTDNSAVSDPHMVGGLGWLKFDRDGERLNIATLPFPSRTRMEKCVEGNFEDYPSLFGELVRLATRGFGEGSNIFLSHVFMDGCLLGDERALNAVKLTKELLPDADYCALGHIHKPQCVSRSKNAFYSGSLLRYHFDEEDAKEFIIFDSKTKDVSHFPITSGKRLERVFASDFATAMDGLTAAGDCYAELIYESATPLKPSESEALRSTPCLAKLTVINKNLKREVLSRREQTDAELFETYYKAVRGRAPDETTLKAFLEVLE